ncbi:hypothetical protein [Streptomyces sp. NPDC056883]|uniref:hypothetical protein n=1 Tax=Streptomyces sp. NPDC056883 TaxID=3345959 RepID=UPI0036ABFC3F
MSARTAAVLRNASAAFVVAAIAGTVLMPLSAHADESNPKALKTTMSAPAPSGPLARGGATETFELTVANTTDKVSSYHPWMILETPGSTVKLQESDVVFKVEAVSAPETTSSIGQQDGGWQGLFRPAAAGNGGDAGFEIPAGGKLTWKVTMGLGKSYPANTGDFTLRSSSYKNEIADGGEASLTFKTSTAPTAKAPTSTSTATAAPAPAGSASAAPAAPSTESTHPATGSMAHTDSDSDSGSDTGLYVGLAAALVAIGGAAAWFVARRRKADRG